VALVCGIAAAPRLSEVVCAVNPRRIIQLVRKGKKTAADAARLFGVHRATVTRLLQAKLAA